ncbi:hypothetical protein INR49_000267, partial [Caranx melampygus]
MFACAKSLFISDQDKRKLRLLLRLFLGNRGSGFVPEPNDQSHLQTLTEETVHEECRPSPEVQVCISSCSRVALFKVSALRQSALGTLCGQRSVLGQRPTVDGLTITMGKCAYVVIRKVNKQYAILDVDEPVSQLHKCAFQFRDIPHAYLCLSNDNIIQYQASCSIRDPSRVILNDGSCWTIIGVETVEFTFIRGWPASRLQLLRFLLSQGWRMLMVNGGGHVAMLEIHGENFSPHLKVWFGNSEAETMFKSPKSLLCVVPDVSVFNGGWRSLRRVITVPLSLIRMDGLIYRTSFSFTYTPEIQPSALVRGGGGGGGGEERVERVEATRTTSCWRLFIKSSPEPTSTCSCDQLNFMGKTDEIQIKAKATASTTCRIQSLDRCDHL